LEWLGAVPSHWDVRRLKEIAEAFPSNVDKKAYENDEPIRLCNYTDVYYNDKITSGMSFMEATATQEQIDRFSLRSGDVIITKDSESADDIAIAAFVPDDLPGVVCGYHLSMVRARAANSGAFLKRYFDSPFAKANFAVRANGLTRVGLGQYAVDNVPVPCPPIDEQLVIAAFLDRETARIDALIEEQERLIALLKEKRQAVISHAVTKGLDPTAPMKDSGVGWLGEVPAHWEVLPLKHAVRLRSGEAITSDTINDAGDFPVFGGNGLRGFTDEYTHDGDYVLVGRQGALCGNINYASGKFWASEHAIVATPSRPVVTRWLGELLRVMNLGQYSTSAAQPGLAAEVLGNLRCPYPPPSEQALIAALLDREIEFSEGLMAEAQAAVTLLQERRSALISAAVTGKIDVSDAHSTSVETEGFSHADL
jgi:type I restriction enzyme S subunit